MNIACHCTPSPPPLRGGEGGYGGGLGRPCPRCVACPCRRGPSLRSGTRRGPVPGIASTCPAWDPPLNYATMTDFRRVNYFHKWHYGGKLFPKLNYITVFMNYYIQYTIPYNTNWYPRVEHEKSNRSDDWTTFFELFRIFRNENDYRFTDTWEL